jgi:hypothetical protein
MVLIFDQDRATVSGPSPVHVSFHVVCNRTLTRGSKIKRSDSRFIRLSLAFREDATGVLGAVETGVDAGEDCDECGVKTADGARLPFASLIA